MDTIPSRARAERRAREKAAMDQRTAESTEKWAKIYKERRVANERKAAEARATADETTVDTDEREEGEILSQDSGATETQPTASSQQPSGADALLASFSPRKEPLKTPAGQKPSEKHDEYAKLGKPPASREQNIELGNSLSKLNTTVANSESLNSLSSTSETTLTGVSKPNFNDRSSVLGGLRTKLEASDMRKDSTETAKPTSAKRSAPPSAYVDERRKSVSNLPKIPKRTSAASPKSPDRNEGQQLPVVGNRGPPKWYMDTPVPTARLGDDINADILLQRLRGEVRKCRDMAPTSSRAPHPEKFNEVREILHKLFFNPVSASLLKKNRLLHDEGLPQIFNQNRNGSVSFPWDISADAHELYNKWSRRIFDTDIFRGIKFGQTMANKKDGSRNTDSIDPNYTGVVSAKYYGEGDLLNGQWWPTQLCTLRDGAHGVSQGGISGKPGDGAFSCIMSGGHDYPDEDRGDEVLYCGTDSDNGEMTTHTKLMMESVNNHPVRLIRSHNLDSSFAPKKGFRYDGLYKVVSFKNLDHKDSQRQRHRFKLERVAGQDPIRGGTGPECRPTDEELEQYNKHMRLSGKKKGPQ